MARTHLEFEVPRWRLRISVVATWVGGACVTVGGWIADAGFGLASATAEWAMRGMRETRASASSREAN